MAATQVTDWIEYSHYGCSAYRIWTRETEFGWFQRHEWKMRDGSTDMDEWVSTPFTSHAAASHPVEA